MKHLPLPGAVRFPYCKVVTSMPCKISSSSFWEASEPTSTAEAKDVLILGGISVSSNWFNWEKVLCEGSKCPVEITNAARNIKFGFSAERDEKIILLKSSYFQITRHIREMYPSVRK